MASNADNNSPALFTGNICNNSGLIAAAITIGLPSFQSIPSAKSFHNTKLSLVYGAAPYLVAHHVGWLVYPNISHGVLSGVVVS